MQSALESHAGSSSNDSEDSTGPGFDSSSSSGESEEENSNDFVEEVPAPEVIRRPTTGVRVLRAQLLPVRRPKPKEPFPRARKGKVAAGPANSSGKQVAGEASAASSKKALGC